jgi:polysaccharide biosynthesis transport protein
LDSLLEMNEKQPDSQVGGMSLGDIYFVLFRWKWLILAFSLLGIVVAALLLFVIKRPQYQSQAMISIRYVVEGRPLNAPGDLQTTRSLDEGSETIMNTEREILYSFDLAEQVAQMVTPERILAKVGGGTNIDQAAAIVRGGMAVEQVPESSAIRITFQNPDRALVQPILNEIIDAFLMKHAQLHRGLGESDAFLTNETERLRAELVQTDNQLKKIKSAIGVISIEDTQKAYADQIAKIRQGIFSAEAELSERQAILKELTGSAGSTNLETTNVALTTEAPAQEVDKYKQTCALLAYLKGKEDNYLTQQGFTPENVLVKQVHEQIVQNETLKRNLEENFPGLAAMNIPVSKPAAEQIIGQPGGDEGLIDLTAEPEQVQVAAVKARIHTLKSQLNQLWAEVTNFDNVTATISDLEQKREVEQTNLKYFMSNLEEARIDAALGDEKAANISLIQAPSPPTKGWSKSFKKKVAMVAVGGILGGLALAFLIELVLDRSIKRPTDIETKLRLPLFISIPAIVSNGHHHVATSGKQLPLRGTLDNERETAAEVVSHQVPIMDLEHRQHPFRRFSEGLRDRLIVYFETRNLTHKPKLVAVTSCGKGAGVSTIAASVAASLSETGDGNVLLVNISGAQGAAQQYYKGKPGCSLDEALSSKPPTSDTNQGAFVKANLYTTVEQSGGDMLPANLTKKISALMPKLKASEYDYIIFDMPPVNQTSSTARLSGLMDMVLLVIESEKTNQDVVKRVNQLLVASKATVGTVLNKTRNYVPPRLHQEFWDNL